MVAIPRSPAIPRHIIPTLNAVIREEIVQAVAQQCGTLHEQENSTAPVLGHEISKVNDEAQLELAQYTEDRADAEVKGMSLRQIFNITYNVRAAIMATAKSALKLLTQSNDSFGGNADFL